VPIMPPTVLGKTLMPDGLRYSPLPSPLGASKQCPPGAIMGTELVAEHNRSIMRPEPVLRGTLDSPGNGTDRTA